MIIKIRLLPHEFYFNAFLLLMAVLLTTRGEIRLGLFYVALLGVKACLLLWNNRRPGRLSETMRLLFYPVTMNLVFAHLRWAVPAVHPGLEDARLCAVDQWILGGQIGFLIEPWVRLPVTEIMTACYMVFFPYLIFSLIWYLAGPLERAKSFYAGLFTIYGWGFLGYTLMPARGPYVFLADQFTVNLQGPLTHWFAQIVPLGTNGVDVFPSLHCAVSLYILLYDFCHKKWRFWGYLIPCVGLWLSTLYLRYHYFIDVLCGFALAGTVFLATQYWERKGEFHGSYTGVY